VPIGRAASSNPSHNTARMVSALPTPISPCRLTIRYEHGPANATPGTLVPERRALLLSGRF
jgi:hypothetical protein